MAMASRRYCCRLSMDIIHDILLRLRVKTLCKFLCVSKSWYTLISDPIFQSSYDHRAKENPFVIFSNGIDRTAPRDDIHISLLDSKGNLFEKSIINLFEKSIIKRETASITHTTLLSSRWFTISPDLFFFFYNVYVHNTFTRDIIKMPRTKILFVDRCVLAHAPSTKEYKLLAIGFSNPFASTESYQYEVITIGDDCWRTLSNPPIPINKYWGEHAEGAIYMMPKFDDDDPYVKGIVRFDLDREEWSVVPTPSGHGFRGPYSYILRGTGEQLWVAEWSLLGDEEFDLWSLEDRDKGVWMKQCKVRMPVPEVLFPVAVDNDGRVLILAKGKLLLYNSDGRKNFQVIMEDKDNKVGRISFYVESFEFIKCLALAEARGTKEKEPAEIKYSLDI